MFSKKWITAVLGTAALCAAGCSGSDVAGQDPAGSSNSSLIAPCTTIPLLSGSFLGCSAFGTTAALGAANTAAIAASTASTAALSSAATVQATLATQMNAIFAGLTVVPDINAMNVTIASSANAFAPLFGTSIVLPIAATTGIFTGAIPFTLTGLPPLILNVWGQFPLINGAFATMPMSAINFSVALANTAAATSAATMAATTTAAMNTAFLASTIPLGFTCNATIPVTCPAFAPAGFVAPAAIAPLAPIDGVVAPIAPVAPAVGVVAPVAPVL